VTRTVPETLVDVVLSRGLRAGSLTLIGRDGAERRFEGAQPGPSAVVELKTARAARRSIAGGSLGFAEAYMDGEWDTSDLDAVLALGVANMAPEPTRPNLLTPLARAWHRMRDNDLDGSRKNIAHHYDLGNDFYRLWLDPTMTYSSALFSADDEDLRDAQVRKWDRLLELLQPTSKDRLLEIGCGWGGFAIHAARQAGCRITGLTLSTEQQAWASAAVEEAGVEDLVEIRLQDYRQVPDDFTGIASIEMFEAVGEKWWPVFFRQLRERLPRAGAAALQVITIEEPRFEDYRHHPDFIQRYIFPGGMLPSPERFAASAEAEGLTASEPHFFGDSYAHTLGEWRARFESALPQVRELGFDERFIRMWRYYLAYCRAGFSEGTIDVMQVRLGG
jgi:cyclopropane-fatty-acyl-phospholipid synthase